MKFCTLLACPPSKISVNQVQRTQVANSSNRAIGLLRRDDLEGDSVACHGSKVVVPYPLGNSFAAFNADTLVGPKHSLLLFCIPSSKVFSESGSHDENIAFLEFCALVLSNCLKVLERNGMSVKAPVLDALGLSIGSIVEEDAAADESASFLPVCGRG